MSEIDKETWTFKFRRFKIEMIGSLCGILVIIYFIFRAGSDFYYDKNNKDEKHDSEIRELKDQDLRHEVELKNSATKDEMIELNHSMDTRMQSIDSKLNILIEKQ